MIFLLILICVAFAVWILKIRPAMMEKKIDNHLNDFTCPAPEGLTKDMLMEALRNNLYYPGFKNCYYDEEGNIVLVCREGKHIVEVSEGRIFVQPIALVWGKQRRMRYAQEAEALLAYIWKIFDSTAPVNGYRLYQKITYSKVGFGFAIGLIVVTTLSSLLYLSSLGDISIQNSYLTDYSTTMTVGEAFDRFFDTENWNYYSAGSQKFCDFTGTHTNDSGDISNFKITFEIIDDVYGVHSITVDDVELWKIAWSATIQRIYNNND